MSTEYLFQAQCDTMLIDGQHVPGPTIPGDHLMMSCSHMDLGEDQGSLEDCVNGVWMGPNFNGGQTNYSMITNTYKDKISNRAVSFCYLN